MICIKTVSKLLGIFEQIGQIRQQFGQFRLLKTNPVVLSNSPIIKLEILFNPAKVHFYTIYTRNTIFLCLVVFISFSDQWVSGIWNPVRLLNVFTNLWTWSYNVYNNISYNSERIVTGEVKTTMPISPTCARPRDCVFCYNSRHLETLPQMKHSGIAST